MGCTYLNENAPEEAADGVLHGCVANSRIGKVDERAEGVSGIKEHLRLAPGRPCRQVDNHRPLAERPTEVDGHLMTHTHSLCLSLPLCVFEAYCVQLVGRDSDNCVCVTNGERDHRCA